jgi:hypothetical protein
VKGAAACFAFSTAFAVSGVHAAEAFPGPATVSPQKAVAGTCDPAALPRDAIVVESSGDALLDRRALAGGLTEALIAPDGAALQKEVVLDFTERFCGAHLCPNPTP